jgi:methionyl-tRNA synthetase
LEELPADLWRWWLIANAPETSDADFNTGRFVADVNKDLADIFGNPSTASSALRIGPSTAAFPKAASL